MKLAPTEWTPEWSAYGLSKSQLCDLAVEQGLDWDSLLDRAAVHFNSDVIVHRQTPLASGELTALIRGESDNIRGP